MKGKAGKEDYPKPGKVSKKWGNNKRNLLLAFKFEISQMCKSLFTDSSNAIVHKFQRDYTEYLNQDDLSNYAQKKFGFPQQKLKLLIINILIYELKTVVHEVTADLINDFLFKKEKHDNVMLEKISGGLQMRIPTRNWEDKRDILSAIIDIESRVTKEEVCKILSLPPPIDRFNPHDLLLSIRMQNDSMNNNEWKTIGTVTVPNDESICEIESHVTALHCLWKEKYGKPPVIAPTENNDDNDNDDDNNEDELYGGDYHGYSYLEIEDKLISLDLELEAFAADKIQEKNEKEKNGRLRAIGSMHLSSEPSVSTSSSSISFDSSTSDESNELEFDQKIRKGRRLWQDIENIETCNWVATTGDTDDEDEDNKDDQLKEINNENVINNCSNSDGNYSEDGYYSDTDLITEKTAELYGIFGGFVRISFPLTMTHFEESSYERRGSL